MNVNSNRNRFQNVILVQNIILGHIQTFMIAISKFQLYLFAQFVGFIQYYQSAMISELFNAPFNKYADDRIELQQIEEMSPVTKNQSFMQNLTESAKLRLEKLHKLPHQIQSLIEALVPQNYKEELTSLRDPQFLRVKNTRDMFFGETSICQSLNMFSRQKCKVAQGLCEIFFENQSYLIGFFQNGRLQKSFIWILKNGNYIKAKQKIRQPKRSVSGFITDDSEELAESSSSQDDERIEQAQIRVQINDQKMTDIYSNLQCEILYNEVYYRGSIKNGHLNGNVEEKTQQYQFQGVFQMGQRKKGRLVSKKGFEYEGTFKNNKFDGLGTLKTSDGVYSGQFKNGLKNGEGHFKWKDGSQYHGDFKNDLRHGKGYFKSLEGSFKGQWLNDQIQGSGYLVIGNQGVGGEWRKNSYEKPNKFF